MNDKSEESAAHMTPFLALAGGISSNILLAFSALKAS